MTFIKSDYIKDYLMSKVKVFGFFGALIGATGCVATRPAHVVAVSEPVAVAPAPAVVVEQTPAVVAQPTVVVETAPAVVVTPAPVVYDWWRPWHRPHLHPVVRHPHPAPHPVVRHPAPRGPVPGRGPHGHHR